MGDRARSCDKAVPCSGILPISFGNSLNSVHFVEMDLIALALEEDIGSGDVTTGIFTDGTRQAHAKIVAREECVLAGSDVVREVYRRIDSGIHVSGAADGQSLEKGSVAMEIFGRAAPILTGERVALNFLQRLSGVATLTRRYVDAVAGTGVTILDTRKTTPGFRVLEKSAVVAGGGKNHRLGLHDMVMVKDNHLAAGTTIADLQPGIHQAKERGLRVEVEVDNLDQLRQALSLEGIDVVLLDNMSLDQLRQAVAMRPPGIAFEASGGVNLQTIRAIAETGVDLISVGALTHSAVAVDFGMDW